MLLHKSDDPFDSSDYLTELKLDGIRLIYSVDAAGKVRLYTRHNNEVTAKFPELHSLALPPGTTLDGELISTDPLGKPDFEAMMSRCQSVTTMPLLDRKEILTDLVPEDSALLSKVKFLEGHGAAYYDAVCGQALEGVVLKRKDSRYEVGKRSHSWLKVINYQYADVYVVGRRKGEFGWLLNFDDGRYAGVMELGIPPVAKRKVYAAQTIDESVRYEYIASIKCRVKYRNLTKAGLLRLPSFVEFV
jgi:DNA ligase-1